MESHLNLSTLPNCHHPSVSCCRISQSVGRKDDLRSAGLGFSHGSHTLWWSGFPSPYVSARHHFLTYVLPCLKKEIHCIASFACNHSLQRLHGVEVPKSIIISDVRQSAQHSALNGRNQLVPGTHSSALVVIPMHAEVAADREGGQRTRRATRFSSGVM